MTRTGHRHGVYCLSISVGWVIPPVHTVTIDEVQEVYDNYNQYVSGKMKSSTTGYGIQALPELDLRFVKQDCEEQFALESTKNVGRKTV